MLAKKKRNAAAFEQAAVEIAALLDKAEQGEITVAYLDEAGHSTIQPNRSCWTLRGEVHAIDASRGPRLNVIGALLSDGTLFTQKKWGSMTAEEFLMFVTELVERVQPTLEKPLCAIIDNASIHKAKAIQPGIDALKARGLMLYFLPAYSPELNRIEILWRRIKYGWMRFQCWTKETLEAEVTRVLDGFGQEFQLAFRAKVSAETR